MTPTLESLERRRLFYGAMPSASIADVTVQVGRPLILTVPIANAASVDEVSVGWAEATGDAYADAGHDVDVVDGKITASWTYSHPGRYDAFVRFYGDSGDVYDYFVVTVTPDPNAPVEPSLPARPVAIVAALVVGVPSGPMHHHHHYWHQKP